MGEVVTLADHKPHLSGMAKCIACGHEWTAVAPVSTDALDCPKCETYNGVWMGIALPAKGTIWQCHCKNEFFVITETAIMCVKCGDAQLGIWD